MEVPIMRTTKITAFLHRGVPCSRRHATALLACIWAVAPPVVPTPNAALAQCTYTLPATMSGTYSYPGPTCVNPSGTTLTGDTTIYVTGTTGTFSGNAAIYGWGAAGSAGGLGENGGGGRSGYSLTIYAKSVNMSSTVDLHGGDGGPGGIGDDTHSPGAGGGGG